MSQWTPPDNPSPREILALARQDARAERFDDALAKHLWYHRNALQYEPAQRGVRLSFAISDWKDLGDRFEPARAAFLAERERAKAKMIANREDVESVWEWAAFNWAMGETRPSSDFFVQLDKEGSPIARDVYDRFEDALLAEGHAPVCARYVDGERSYGQACGDYDRSLELAARVNDPIHMQVIHRHFAVRTAELVAILAVGGRTDEAARYVNLAKSKIKDQRFSGMIDEALLGSIPDRNGFQDLDFND